MRTSRFSPAAAALGTGGLDITARTNMPLVPQTVACHHSRWEARRIDELRLLATQNYNVFSSACFRTTAQRLARTGC